MMCFASPEHDVITVFIVDCVMIVLVYCMLLSLYTYFLLCALLTYNIIIKQPYYLNIYYSHFLGSVDNSDVLVLNF